MGRKCKEKEIRQCLQCGKETTNKKFCSLSCNATYYFKNKEKRKLICEKCGSEFIPKGGVFRRFCSRSCSASYNNIIYIKRKKSNKNKKSICLNCGNDAKNKNKFCCINCRIEYEYNEYIKKWKNGEVSGNISFYHISRHLQKYLRLKYNNSCSECGWSKINIHTNKVPLQVHHKDGNFKNNKEENLELLCGACHSLTDTYCGLNRGNGRKREKISKQK